MRRGSKGAGTREPCDSTRRSDSDGGIKFTQLAPVPCWASLCGGACTSAAPSATDRLGPAATTAARSGSPARPATAAGGPCRRRRETCHVGPTGENSRAGRACFVAASTVPASFCHLPPTYVAAARTQHPWGSPVGRAAASDSGHAMFAPVVRCGYRYASVGPKLGAGRRHTEQCPAPAISRNRRCEPTRGRPRRPRGLPRRPVRLRLISPWGASIDP